MEKENQKETLISEDDYYLFLAAHLEYYLDRLQELHFYDAQYEALTPQEDFSEAVLYLAGLQKENARLLWDSITPMHINMVKATGGCWPNNKVPEGMKTITFIPEGMVEVILASRNDLQGVEEGTEWSPDSNWLKEHFSDSYKNAIKRWNKDNA